MCGRDTLATEVSSTSMNVAMLTVMAISHGLCFGTQGRSFKLHLPFNVRYCTVSYRLDGQE
jgi:hypothetical protein